MQKRPSYHFLHFTRKEKNGTIFILFIILLLTILPFIYSALVREKNIETWEFRNELASLQTSLADSSKKTYEKNYRSETFPVEEIKSNAPVNLFYFDPNTLTISGWKKLGVNDKTIATIQNYLSKGGKFREAGDFKKIWGLAPAKAEQLMPYVKIEKAQVNSSIIFPVHEKKAISAIEVNSADSSAYVALPGIGPGFAKRIIKFRDKLGGFYKIEQVGETFGLPDSTFQEIKNYLQVSPENIKKININTATLDQLKEHPYIRYQLANAIIQFRSSHGNFTSVEDIKKIMLITDDIFSRISPYLAVQ